VEDDGDAGSRFAAGEEELAVLVGVVAVAVRAARDDGDGALPVLEEAVALCGRDRFAARSGLHLAQNRGHVVFDRAGREE
jgi:hypothetical protein